MKHVSYLKYIISYIYSTCNGKHSKYQGILILVRKLHDRKPVTHFEHIQDKKPMKHVENIPNSENVTWPGGGGGRGGLVLGRRIHNATNFMMSGAGTPSHNNIRVYLFRNTGTANRDRSKHICKLSLALCTRFEAEREQLPRYVCARQLYTVQFSCRQDW